MVIFKQKAYSNYISDYAWKGGVVGGNAGAILSTCGAKPKFKGKGVSGAVLVGGGAIVGAALGALVGTVMEVSQYINRSGTDNRLMSGVLKGLKDYEEDKDYTRDPKEADLLKTKVCISFTRDSADFKVLVNLWNDKKLKGVSEKIIKKLPGTLQVRHQQASNKFNEIGITTISSAASNIGLITDIVKGFINAGYPVYMIEVG